MSKKIIFKGNPDGVFQAFEPNLEQVLRLENTPCDTEEERVSRQAELVMEHFRKKNIRIGRLAAENLCARESASYTIRALDTETALPIKITVAKEEIEQILAPLGEEQKAE